MAIIKPEISVYICISGPVTWITEHYQDAENWVQNKSKAMIQRMAVTKGLVRYTEEYEDGKLMRKIHGKPKH